ncbi:Uma2 family endonuclease [soil metagenome]
MTEQLPLNISHFPVRLRVEDYLMLGQSGALDAYRKTELIEGEILYMNAQHPPHARVKSRLHVLLAQALAHVGNGLEAVVESTVAMPPIDAPEPDIVLTSEAAGEGLIPLASVRLIVEVADAILQHDLNRKSALYARHAVPEYWVVDVQGRTIHQMWAPALEAYSERRQIAFGAPVHAATIDGIKVETAVL